MKIRAVCVSRKLCGLIASCLAVVRGSLAVMRGSLAVEHRAHPVACGLLVLIVVCSAVVGAGDFSTDAGAYVAPDSCLIALGGAAIALVSGAIVRVSGAIVRVSVLSGH